MIAEVCRETSPQPEIVKPANTGRRAPQPPQTIAGCEVVLHLTVKPGPSEADDPLPAALTVDPVAPLGYRIRMLNSKDHSAGFSHMVLVPSGQAPPQVAGLHATATRNGALLEWQPLPSASLIELDRTLAVAPSPKAPSRKSAVSLPDEQPSEVKLRTGHDEEKDAGGTLDRTVLHGQSYIYRAERIRKVELEGKRYELRSDASAPVTLAMTDRFAPAAPTGLAAIPGSRAGTATIDLSWQPNVEPDVAGYNVYRRQGSSGSFERVTAKLVLGPAFSDTAAVLGTSYTYRVTAVDDVGNESSPSGEVTEIATRP